MTRQHASCAAHRSHGLTCDAYDGLRKRADDRCEVDTCRATAAGPRPLHIDHDHDLGDWYVRGLLCSRDNATLAHVAAGRTPLRSEHVRYLAAPWHATNPPPTRRVWTRAKVAERAAIIDALRQHAPRADRGGRRWSPDEQRDALIWRALELGASRGQVSMAAAVSWDRVSATYQEQVAAGMHPYDRASSSPRASGGATA